MQTSLTRAPRLNSGRGVKFEIHMVGGRGLSRCR